MCSFVRYCPIPLHKDGTSFHSNKQCKRGLISLQLCQWSVLLYFKKICQIGEKQYLGVALICICHLMGEFGQTFLCLRVNCLLVSLPIFYWVFFH